MGLQLDANEHDQFYQEGLAKMKVLFLFVIFVVISTSISRRHSRRGGIDCKQACKPCKDFMTVVKKAVKKSDCGAVVKPLMKGMFCVKNVPCADKLCKNVDKNYAQLLKGASPKTVCKSDGVC
ncbi:hypothetical protein TELCIR_06588 [Teladorsagia circumcincta]|uniref:Uncharacterized protein n=1 Tax=Teladorsagia circumcincta TaxID=45464 RepID=A0A2G9UPX7_TELCI|nr:hypothetical protein TELCIR_06588 [Teladorsagia circumcincta]